MATKRITCREWCEKNNVPIESLVVNRGSDNDKYFFIEQESFKKSPFHLEVIPKNVTNGDILKTMFSNDL